MLNLYTEFIHVIESGLLRQWPWPGELTTFLLILIFGLLSNFELQSPKVAQSRERLAESYRINLGLFAFNSILVSILSLSSLLMMIENLPGPGLLRTLTSPVLKAVLSFLLLDLFMYLWHKLCHGFDGLWLFHKVHHSDPYLNVSTAFRIHLVEMLTTALLKAIYIVAFGIDKRIVVLYEAVYTVFVMFHHANIGFRGERWLGKVFITPYLHRSHHSTERKEHDSNYGAIFSIWDRLAGTYKALEPRAIGIKQESPQSLSGQIGFGLGYPLPAFSRPVANLHPMIAEAAYYRAEKRSFTPGYELHDWVEAKKDIFRQYRINQCAKC